MKLTNKARIILLGAAAIVVVFGLRYAYLNGYIPGVKPAASSVPKLEGSRIPKNIELARSTAPQVPLPSTKPTRLNKPMVRALVWAWNAQIGELFANGGAITTQGSLMEKHGVKMQITRQDNTEKMKADLISFATELKEGNPNPSSGAHFVQIMGDQYGAFAASVNPLLKKLGQEYQVRTVGSSGRSIGEDGFWGPSAWLSDPKKAKGGVIIGVLREGDWNIAMKWLKDNGIKNNADETTYDADAVNWIAADDYLLDAVDNKLIGGFLETRPVVKDGKKTGTTFTIDCKDPERCGVVTWTPGDVHVAQKLGGLVRILSTKENEGQMPNAIIGIGKWCTDNRETVDEMLAAIFDGADQVRLYPEALQQAGVISAKVYGEETGEYWVKYYNGVTEKDRTGRLVELGGSAVHNLEDNLNLFGLTPGKANQFEATYVVFGDVVVDQYPRLVPSYPPFKDVVDTSFLLDVQRKYPVVQSAEEAPAYSANDAITQRTGNRDWSINFKSGSAELTPDGLKTVETLARELTINNLAVEIHGHTDNAGTQQSNLELSRRRAETVQHYLETKYPGTFPPGRLRVKAHGQDAPVADNSTEAGKAKNRRVQIIQGTT